MRAAWQAMQSRVFPVNRSWNSGGLHLHGFKEIPGGNLTMHAELILEEANQGTAGVPSLENIS